MSHYTVAVITHTGDYEEVYNLLAPFDECLGVEPYISRTREEIISDGKKHQKEWIEHIKSDNVTKDELVNFLVDPNRKWFRDIISAETDEDFLYAEAYSDQLHADENEYSTYNPDSKWDWWEIGGRWSNSLRDFNGDYHDILKIADWDYNYIDLDDIAHYSRFWEIAVEGAEPTEEEKNEFILWYKPEYYIEKYGNKSNYIKSMMTFSTYAVLTPDGEWLEPGKMGWWGVSHANPIDQGLWERDFTSLIDTFDKDMYVTIVDCHI